MTQETIRVNVELDKEVWKKVGIAAASQGKLKKEVLAEAIKKYCK